jgi:hypothetical protein
MSDALTSIVCAPEAAFLVCHLPVYGDEEPAHLRWLSTSKETRETAA